MDYPDIDPVAFSLGPIEVHWYGLMYLFGFAIAWGLGAMRAKRPGSGWEPREVGDLVFYCALGVILGARVGYHVFYNFQGWMQDPLVLLRLWEGGMSFHGGAIGVVIAFWYFSRQTGKRFVEAADFLSPMAPLGLALGRLGNFINGELWGRAADVPWAMVFPADPLQIERHPSQLYQASMEGLLLFVILWIYSSKPRPAGAVTGLFGIGYGVFRIIGEFFREPDAHIGFIAFDWLTMGQLLSVPLIIVGALFMYFAFRNERRSST